MTIKIPPSEVCGYFTLDAHKVIDGEIVSSRRLAGPFPNIITDQGLDRMGGNTGWMGSCQVGSGNATPTAADTSLQTWVAGVSSIQSSNTSVQVSVSPYYVSRVNVYRFGTGVAAGNLSEVGVGWGSSGSVLYSRALIVDGSGTPTTITVLSDEVLDVTYEWRTYPPLVDVTGTVDGYDYTLRAANINQYKTGVGPGWGSVSDRGSAASFSSFGNDSYNGAIGAITTGPSGTGTGASTSNLSYTPGTLVRGGQLSWGLGSTNSVKSIRFSMGCGMYQIGFSPTIPKNGTNNLIIVVEHSWARRTI